MLDLLKNKLPILAVRIHTNLQDAVQYKLKNEKEYPNIQVVILGKVLRRTETYLYQTLILKLY